MVKKVIHLTENELVRMIADSLNEDSGMKDVLKQGMNVYWKYRKEYFGKTLEGIAYGKVTGKHTAKNAWIKLTTMGPNNQPSGQEIRVSIDKLRTVDGNRPLMTPEEHERKCKAAIESNPYFD